MGLEPGDITATGGMSKAIYDALFNNMKDGFPDSEPSEDVCQSWKKLAYSIAFGVIEHIKSNMEIKGITTKGDVSITISGSTGIADPADHTHSVGLSDTDSDVVFTQNNDGTGLVQ
ncbi:MAG: hypothetical protein GTO45_41065 [Candidatus Aminicenantes bacterium]|nr:hypothetical protein [Candidatus Aminicenantes bacterium]NIM84996.1 hypothetical protein [Candidatus Aminicenantes bacterium]NIN24510.1 hypothetical protein [Candidatus Aminicenantes bacterium]NIN48274.1 hypothetical protein [Candidatus Aminicenantes bacterium]NIN91177.1 hypothetical protein [Candidatus Aminicenantes bacterium]